MLIINRLSGIKRRRQGGTAAVEFALVLPILLLLLFGIVELSLLQYDLLVIANASREAARFGIKKTYADGNPTWPTKAETETIGNNYIDNAGLYSFGGTNRTTTVAAPCTASGQQLNVTVSFTYSFLTLANLMGWSNTKVLNAPTVMICE